MPKLIRGEVLLETNASSAVWTTSTLSVLSKLREMGLVNAARNFVKWEGLATETSLPLEAQTALSDHLAWLAWAELYEAEFGRYSLLQVYDWQTRRNVRSTNRSLIKLKRADEQIRPPSFFAFIKFRCRNIINDWQIRNHFVRQGISILARFILRLQKN